MIRVHTLAQGKLTTSSEVARPAAGTQAWIEVVAPEPDEIAALAKTLGLHELSLSDAQRVGHPPKLEDFGEHLFVIAHTPESDEDGGTRKIAIFLAKDWVVTILRVPLDTLAGVADRVERDPAHYLSPPAFLAHTVIDTMTDAFEQNVDSFFERLENLEDRIEENPDPSIMNEILAVRREVTSLVRVVRGQRDVCQSLSRSTHPTLPKRLQPFLRDVYDHILRVYDLLEGVRDALGAARDAHMTAVNNRLSEVMKVLTIIATIMMPLSLLAGVYGMNFEWMPGVKEPAGFWILSVAMAVIAAGMLVWFRRRKWI